MSRTFSEHTPPKPDSLAICVEEAAQEILMIKEIEIAASRMALVPNISKSQIKSLGAVPLTDMIGINTAGSIRALSQIISSNNARLATTSETWWPTYRHHQNYRLKIWRLPHAKK